MEYRINRNAKAARKYENENNFETSWIEYSTIHCMLQITLVSLFKFSPGMNKIIMDVNKNKILFFNPQSR